MARMPWVVMLAALAAGCGDKAPTAAGEAPAEAVAAAEPGAKAEAPGAAAPASPKLPGTADGARRLLAAFVAEGADPVALSAQLRPTPADYAAVFVEGAAAQAMAAYQPAWDAGQLVVRPKPGQTEVLVFEATTDQIKAGDPSAKDFPGGYADIADRLKPGVTLYRFKFVEPGQTTGMAFDGLTHVDGRWVIFPKPWRALR